MRDATKPIVLSDDEEANLKEIDSRLDELFSKWRAFYRFQPTEAGWQEMALRLAIEHDPLMQPHIPSQFKKWRADQQDYGRPLAMMRYLIRTTKCSQKEAAAIAAKSFKEKTKTLEVRYSEAKKGKGAPDVQFYDARIRNHLYLLVEKALARRRVANCNSEEITG